MRREGVWAGEVAVGQGRNRWQGYWSGRIRGRRGKEEVTEGLIYQVRHLVMRVTAGLPKELSCPW